MALVILYCFNLFGPLLESDKETRFLEKFIRHLPIDSTVLGSFQMRIHAHNVCFMSYFNRSGPIFLNFDARDEILAIYFEFRDGSKLQMAAMNRSTSVLTSPLQVLDRQNRYGRCNRDRIC